MPAQGKKKPTKREKAFVEALIDPEVRTDKEAAIRAGYSPRSASEIAYEVRRKPHVADYYQRRIDRALAHYLVTPEEVLGSAVFNMRSSVNDLMDEKGFFDLQKARETGAIDLIKEIEFIESTDPKTQKKEVRHKVKFDSPAAARKEVSNYVGLQKFANGDGSNRLNDFKRICSRITEEAILQKVSEREMAAFFLSDERAVKLDADLVRMIADRFLKEEPPAEKPKRARAAKPKTRTAKPKAKTAPKAAAVKKATPRIAAKPKQSAAGRKTAQKAKTKQQTPKKTNE